MKALKIQKEKIIWTAILLCAVLFIWQQFGIRAYAYIQTQGTVTAESANIRKEADASSTAVASVKKGDTLTINNEVTGTDGKTWYYVYVNNSTGYILAELVEKKGGSSTTTTTSQGQTTTPSQTTPDTPSTTPDTTPSQNPGVDGVTAVVNVSATVTGSTVNVRKDANGISSIVSKVQKDMVVTITGRKEAADGKTWYQVFFTSNGTEITGFIRSDYLKADGEIQPVSDVPQETPVVPEEPEEPVEPPKEYDTVNKADAEGVTGWYLIHQQTGKEYKVDELIKAKEEGETLLTETQKNVKSQKVTIIILVLLLIVFAAGIVFLLMKFKDQLLGDFSQNRSYSPARGGRTSSGRNVQRRPQAGSRPQGSSRPQTGARPQGSSRPQSNNRPQGSGSSRAGTRPQGSGGSQAGARPQGSGRSQTGTRPQAGSRPQTGTRPQSNNRPQNSQMPMTHEIHQRTRQSVADQNVQGMVRNTDQKWKSKNFMHDDDEFEFEFLNWDGQEDK